jgi:PEGA domain
VTRIALRRALPLIFFANLALGQEFELDLSEAKPPPPPEEFRPRLAVLSVKAVDSDEVTMARARQFEAEFLKQLAQGDQYQTVVEPSTARQLLATDFAAADACTEYACLEAVAKTLKVHRVVRLTLEKKGAGSMATMYGWDPGFNEVLIVSQDSGEKAERTFLGVAGKSQASKDREFIKRMGPFLAQVQKTLALPNGKIIVDNADPSAVVTIDKAEGGIGSMEAIVQRGTRTVRVTAAGYKPFEQTVTVEPAASVEVKVSLVAVPIEVSTLRVKPTAAPSVFTSPGLYLAIAGAAAVVSGVIIGQSAQSVKNRLAAGGDPVNVTRAEAKVAPTNALMADVLVGAGAAAVAGGVTWIIVTLPPAAPAPRRGGPSEPSESSPVQGAMLSLGGAF